MKKSKILLIYTGGTIGMMEDAESGELTPVDFNHIFKQVPELNKLNLEIATQEFTKPIDSSDFKPDNWINLVEIIENNYSKYNGFVILHGSDTLAFTASALSFMLQNLSKPIILTGSQLPIGVLRTDGKENLITAIEIAAATEKGKAIIPEVAIYFEYTLLRGNRTIKINTNHFDAFSSPNYPKLAEAGISIKYNKTAISKVSKKELRVTKNLDNNVVILKLFPGINKNTVNTILAIPNIKAIVLETFGSGNCTTEPWFIEALKTAIKTGKIIVNITQCLSGTVQMGKYATSTKLKNIGVLSGFDMTTEAAVTKLMYLLGKNYTKNKIRKEFTKPICGELSISAS